MAITLTVTAAEMGSALGAFQGHYGVLYVKDVTDVTKAARIILSLPGEVVVVTFATPADMPTIAAVTARYPEAVEAQEAV